MARIVVVGPGVAGLGAALALGRAGHEVTVVERDATPLPADPDSAFWWDRRGAPQVRHSHAFLARLRNVLRDRHPDVLAALLDAGATELRFAEGMPDTIEDRSPDPRRRGPRGPGVPPHDLRVGAPQGRPRLARRLAARRRGGRRPHRHRRPERACAASPACTWPTAAPSRATSWCWPAAAAATSPPGSRPSAPPTVDEDDEDTGIVYWSRFYRLTGEAPVSDGPIGGDLGYLKFAVFQGDNGTFSVTLATSNEDATLRALSSPDAVRRRGRRAPADRAVARARGERGDHRGAPDGEAAQPHPSLRGRRPPGRARGGRHRRRPHLHQPALRAGLQPRHRPRRAPRRRRGRARHLRRCVPPRLRGGHRARDRALVQGVGHAGPGAARRGPPPAARVPRRGARGRRVGPRGGAARVHALGPPRRPAPRAAHRRHRVPRVPARASTCSRPRTRSCRTPR